MTSDEGLYEKVLAAAGGELAAPRPARGSAAVVLLRRLPEDGIELFWLRRGEILPFMGGWHAFPGGGLERGDANLPVRGNAARSGVRRAGRRAAADEAGSPKELDLVPGLLACALRELFEETGVLVACPAIAQPPGSAPAPGAGRSTGESAAR